MNSSYVLITAAHNEEANIRRTILSILSQTVLPKKWVIISDGTDDTEKIIEEYVPANKWIELVRRTKKINRNFSAMTYCINLGYRKIKNISFQYIAKLDADVSFDSDYFEFLIGKLEENPNLGIVGTQYVEGTYDFSKKQILDSTYIPGMIPLFRREVFEKIGGIPVVKHSECVYTVALALMLGWETRTFLEKKFIHHREIGTATNNILKSKFKLGYWDYYARNHLLWQVFRCLYWIPIRPYMIGGIMLFGGYIWGWICNDKIPLNKDVVRYVRRKQLRRLKEIISKYI